MEHREYLRSLGIDTPPMLNRFSQLLSVAQSVCPETIEDLFLCDFVKEDSSRSFENLWFFSKNFCMEAREFIGSSIDVDITSMAEGIQYLRLQSRDYRADDVIDKSRLNVEAHMTQFNMKMHLKASGDNCTALWRVFERWIRPRIV